MVPIMIETRPRMFERLVPGRFGEMSTAAGSVAMAWRSCSRSSRRARACPGRARGPGLSEGIQLVFSIGASVKYLLVVVKRIRSHPAVGKERCANLWQALARAIMAGDQAQQPQI